MMTYTFEAGIDECPNIDAVGASALFLAEMFLLGFNGVKSIYEEAPKFYKKYRGKPPEEVKSEITKELEKLPIPVLVFMMSIGKLESCTVCGYTH